MYGIEQLLLFPFLLMSSNGGGDGATTFASICFLLDLSLLFLGLVIVCCLYFIWDGDVIKWKDREREAVRGRRWEDGEGED